MNNIIIDNWILFDRREIENIENTHYDEKRGLWIWDETEVLVKSNSADCPIRGTKKADIETGEDKKGE